MKLPGFKKRNISGIQPVEKNSYSLSGLLTGKNVLITGAARNIGRSIALEMAKNGANIFFTDINPELAKKLKEELTAYPVSSKEFISDISSTADIDSLCKSLLRNNTKIDILVNNAGIELNNSSNENDSSARWSTLYNTNVIGPVYLTRFISRMMIDNKITGSILFITSIHQWHISTNNAYSSSKAALGMIIKELAVEFAPYDIRVNGIAPGYIREDENGNPLPHKYTPLYQTSINPCYIGRAAVYLSSDYFSKFTTGTVLKIDSGLSLYNHLTGNTMKKNK